MKPKCDLLAVPSETCWRTCVKFGRGTGVNFQSRESQLLYASMSFSFFFSRARVCMYMCVYVFV